MSKPRQYTLFDGTATTTFNTGIAGHGGENAVFVLDISAASGTTPTLDIVIQEYDEASGTFSTIDTIPQQTGVATVRRTVVGSTTPFGNKLRAAVTIGGTTPSFTFTLSAHDKG